MACGSILPWSSTAHSRCTHAADFTGNCESQVSPSPPPFLLLYPELSYLDSRATSSSIQDPCHTQVAPLRHRHSCLLRVSTHSMLAQHISEYPDRQQVDGKVGKRSMTIT
jgi:hypothetical protein